MARYIFLRILGMIAVVWFIGSVTFLLMHAIPGGPWDEEKPVTPEAKANIRALYGLDRPLAEQYVIYWRNFARLDLGHPYKSPLETVQGLISRVWPVSVQLGLLTVLVSFSLGTFMGAMSARFQNTWIDYLCTGLSVFGIATPNFALALVMIAVFSTILHWLPAGGWEGPRYWIMPVVAFAAAPMGIIARYTRSSMIEVMNENHVRTARAKGLTERAVMSRHVMRNALIPMLTIMGPMIGSLATGSIYIEGIFRIPGIGRYFVSSVSARDYPMIMGLTLLMAVVVAVSYLLTDLAYVFVDPRIKYT